MHIDAVGHCINGGIGVHILDADLRWIVIVLIGIVSIELNGEPGRELIIKPQIDYFLMIIRVGNNGIRICIGNRKPEIPLVISSGEGYRVGKARTHAIEIFNPVLIRYVRLAAAVELRRQLAIQLLPESIDPRTLRIADRSRTNSVFSLTVHILEISI